MVGGGPAPSGAGATQSVTVDCSEGCPDTVEGTLEVNVAGLSEGRHIARLVAENAAGTQTIDRRGIVVDRTSPTTPEDPVGAQDETSGRVMVSWKPGADPHLADGAAGSGILTRAIASAM